ncbi:MAG TPA: MBL fold metallo-hydrolase [Steroidobacteraceae bacterium]|nr:MBL fold metallo-hydrolase [Steroidobacteraceae bacterium]
MSSNPPPALRVAVVPVTPFQQNCSVLWDTATMRGAIVDPGGDLDAVLKVVEREGITLEKILLTHAHIDHAGATAELKRRTGLPIEGPHEGDRFWIEGLAEQGKMFGIASEGAFEPDRWLVDGDRVTVGGLELEVRHCPGHTPGHVVFFHAPSRFAIVGDVLFQGSIGRTDFPGGDHATLIRSIRSKLFPFGDDVRFLPGHGPLSSFGDERRANPFVSDAAVRAR